MEIQIGYELSTCNTEIPTEIQLWEGDECVHTIEYGNRQPEKGFFTKNIRGMISDYACKCMMLIANELMEWVYLYKACFPEKSEDTEGMEFEHTLQQTMQDKKILICDMEEFMKKYLLKSMM